MGPNTLYESTGGHAKSIRILSSSPPNLSPLRPLHPRKAQIPTSSIIFTLDLSRSFKGKQLIGTVGILNYPGFKDTRRSIPPPKKQCYDTVKINTNEPRYACQDWLDDAVKASRPEDLKWV
ncbi:hypothetical protein MGYG_08040 [Nannizzia gypsea CBS 118893]|uniref:Uncharacterized protein n=1 Tax=Arthroderma gypseum (strain ATCC MYA-4604 / CBS 118893) TaxID=535722 RepID=E4V4W0_ARTGP|nr:hypothetical protein MGYG_08040 [Nannizzia gypsea CBS 118893]EFR05034.1 hypothetical protein MGYG_08040 [Nannizzia gypsea CBS 118893]